jgi:hypothetical protein
VNTKTPEGGGYFPRAFTAATFTGADSPPGWEGPWADLRRIRCKVLIQPKEVEAVVNVTQSNRRPARMIAVVLVVLVIVLAVAGCGHNY